ncbi:2-oxoisovalerate dehydrogenase E2 component (dihydrolipoyl transacylase) [Sphingorhabdus rigui]|uniref:Dihydrolipoamide acetyltransferase component of pyruvate dehydrogenase complex n=1 Tax=Sphingorhabdus rigui TaxID=1282858 RepID=A0A840B0J5_9SPHN|nr:dihydrolipoamide acetyltransferase family protein [Sphingorhabdus rigui]MBB3942737.1 2-oxoisovalerate dehydrogenase E2 component (dihydrolipoyl transacylase) [Sphingorhabdus rigui]
MPIFTFNLPDIGEGIAEAEIVAWHVKVGDRISEDQPLADMMTDKATVEMESPVAGVVTKVAGEAGDVVAIGSMLVEIETATDVSQAESAVKVEAAATIEDELPHAPEPVAAEPAVVQERPATASAQSPRISADHKVTASPAVRQRAKELGVELTDVKAAGGHVRHADLDAFLAYGSGQGYRASHISARRDDEIVKVIGMRRRIADNMAASKRHIPHFTYVEEIDVTAIEAMRADLNANRGTRPKLTMLPLLIVAICKTIPQFPMINARYDDENGVVTRHGAVHLGMATQTDAGLMVPVIRDAQDKNIWQLATEIARLADAARSGTAKSEELSGSTLTVTSLGPLGGIVTTPVINRPEVAIIGRNKIVERPMFVGDTIEARKLMNLSISCDHRVVDGWDAANYVQALKKLLETPVLLFAD